MEMVPLFVLTLLSLQTFVGAEADMDYDPDYRGSNIFEQNDSATHNEIKIHLNDVIKKYLPNLQVNEVDVQISENSEYRAVVRIDYTVTEGVFVDTDFVIIEI